MAQRDKARSVSEDAIEHLEPCYQCNAEEAYTRVWLHAKHSTGQRKLIFSPDTDYGMPNATKIGALVGRDIQCVKCSGDVINAVTRSHFDVDIALETTLETALDIALETALGIALDSALETALKI